MGACCAHCRSTDLLLCGTKLVAAPDVDTRERQGCLVWLELPARSGAAVGVVRPMGAKRTAPILAGRGHGGVCGGGADAQARCFLKRELLRLRASVC
jgi:hypothetical protein